MSKTKPPYPVAFREQIVELARAGKSPSALSREFGPSAQSIANWVAQAARGKGKPLPGKEGLSSAEREELVRLRRENRQIKLERDILAKATAWFAGGLGHGRGDDGRAGGLGAEHGAGHTQARLDDPSHRQRLSAWVQGVVATPVG